MIPPPQFPRQPCSQPMHVAAPSPTPFSPVPRRGLRSPSALPVALPPVSGSPSRRPSPRHPCPLLPPDAPTQHWPPMGGPGCHKCLLFCVCFHGRLRCHSGKLLGSGRSGGSPAQDFGCRTDITPPAATLWLLPQGTVKCAAVDLGVTADHLAETP